VSRQSAQPYPSGSAGLGEGDVALGVRERGPYRDEPDRAVAGGAGNGVCERSALGGDEQVAWPRAGGAERACANPKDQVIARMWVARSEAVGKEGVEIGAWRDERLAFDADVVSVGEPGIHDETRPPARGDGKDSSDTSPGAMRSPARRPKVVAATAMLPSTRGAVRVAVCTPPAQSIASTVVLEPALIVTSSLWPRSPVVSNGIPSIRRGAPREAKRRARPSALTTTTPRPDTSRIAYTAPVVP
jgi:hypothetical protein